MFKRESPAVRSEVFAEDGRLLDGTDMCFKGTENYLAWTVSYLNKDLQLQRKYNDITSGGTANL